MGLVNIIVCSKERSNDKGWLSCRKSQSNVTSSRLLLCLFVRQALCGTVDVDSEYEWTTMIDGWQWQKQKIMKGWKRLSLDSVVEKAALFFQNALRSCTSRWPWLRNYLSYLSIVSKNSIIISITDIVSLARAAAQHINEHRNTLIRVQYFHRLWLYIIEQCCEHLFPPLFDRAVRSLHHSTWFTMRAGRNTYFWNRLLVLLVLVYMDNRLSELDQKLIVLSIQSSLDVLEFSRDTFLRFQFFFSPDAATWPEAFRPTGKSSKISLSKSGMDSAKLPRKNSPLAPEICLPWPFSFSFPWVCTSRCAKNSSSDILVNSKIFVK